MKHYTEAEWKILSTLQQIADSKWRHNDATLITTSYETIQSIIWMMKKMGIKYKSKQEMIDDGVPPIIQHFWFENRKQKKK